MKSIKKLVAIALTTLMCASVLGGCKDKTESPATTEPTGPKELKLYLSNPTNLDPQFWTWGTHVARMGVFEGLTKLDSNLKPIAANAEKWEHNSDYTVWTFHLRKGLQWSDGTPITAKDYEYSMKRVVNPKTTNGKTGAFVTGVPIKNAVEINTGKVDADQLGVKAMDDNTLQITLSKGSSILDVSVSESWALPVPKHVIDKFGVDWAKPENIVSNGPYKVKSHEVGTLLKLVSNDKYYGKVNFDSIDVLSGTGNQILAYKNNDINVASVAQADMDMIKADPTLSKEMKTFKCGIVYFMGMLNTEDDILYKNPKVRQAIMMSLDKKTIANDIMRGTVREGKSLIPEIFTSWGNDIGLKYDTSKSKSLMAEAGFPDGKGFPEMTILLAGTPTGRELAIQDMIQKGTGIKVKLLNEEWAVFTKDRDKLWAPGTIGYFIDGWGTGYASYQGYFSNFNFQEKEMSGAKLKEYFAIKNDTKMDPAVKNGKMKEFVAANTSEAGKKYLDLLSKADNTTDVKEQEKLYKEAAVLRENEAIFGAIDWENGVKLIKPELKGYVGNSLLLGTPPQYFNDVTVTGKSK